MRKKVLLLPLMVFILAAGCAATLSTKGKATMMLATYNSQVAATVAMSNRADLTEEQKSIVRQKKAIIVKLDPLIKSFGMIVAQGGTPSLEDEQAIYDFIDDLVLLTP